MLDNEKQIFTKIKDTHPCIFEFYQNEYYNDGIATCIMPVMPVDTFIFGLAKSGCFLTRFLSTFLFSTRILDM